MSCSRRRFLVDTGRGTAGLALAGTAGLGGLEQALAARATLPRVAHLRRPGVIKKDGTLRAELVEKMVFEAVRLATGQGSARDAFAALFRPEDVVGIKVNCLAGKRMSTRPEVALALAKGVQLAGVKPGNVVIWERSSRELTRAGYAVQKSPFELRVLGTDGDYEREPTDAGSVGGCLTKIVTRTCSAQINAPVLKDHDLAGVSLGMKNWYGAIHNPNKYHDNQCAPYVADLSALSPLRQRTRLVVCDALFAQCQGGPAHLADFVWHHEGVLASTDPVAIDALGAQIVEAQRRKKGLPSLLEAERPPRWLALAARHGLGVADLKRVKVIEA